jgi:DHA1 family inner membrane transport protein
VALAAWGVGMVAGGAALPALRQRVAASWILPLAGAAVAVALLGAGLAPSLPALVGWSVIGGAGNGTFAATFLTVVQERTPDSPQVRVSALYEVVITVSLGLGFVAGGLLGAAAGPRAVYVVGGTVGIAAAVRLGLGLRSATRVAHRFTLLRELIAS